VPNPFWGDVAFPLVVVAFLYLWPWLERRTSGDTAFHNLLDRPRDAPRRTAIGFGFFTWVFLVFLAGSADRVDVLLGIGYVSQIRAYRVLSFVAPPVAALVAYRVCRELQQGEPVAGERARARAEAARAEAPREESERRPPIRESA
jgi:ubiquinol-cytochrome c reductase cytochrome b subunit